MGIEPITCRLQGGCSTIEPRRRSIGNVLFRQADALYQSDMAAARLYLTKICTNPAGQESIRILTERQYKNKFKAASI